MRWRATSRRAHRAAIAVAATALAPLVSSTVAASSPPTPPPPTAAPLQLVNGVFTSPDGSFSAAFAAAPSLVDDPGAPSTAFQLAVDEDFESVTSYPLDAFGATGESTTNQRAEFFLDASGVDIVQLANTATRLGPFPAAYFIARLTLSTGGPAVVYGAVVVRGERVAYVIYSDAGGDDAAAGRAFVESYTAHIPVPPAAPEPPAATTTTVSPTTATSGPTAGPTTSAAPTTNAAPTTASPVPAGATMSYDRRWWVTFPDGATPTLRASSENGYAFAEYRAVGGGDVLTVRVTEIPAGFEWDTTVVPGFDDVTVEAAPVDLAGTPAAASTFEAGDATTSALVVNAGTQLITIAYTDAGDPSPDVAATFAASFALAGSG